LEKWPIALKVRVWRKGPVCRQGSKYRIKHGIFLLLKILRMDGYTLAAAAHAGVAAKLGMFKG
jgi:hypothetical protein